MEDRRHTEITDTSKLDPSRWMPLPRYVPRGQQSPGAIKRPSRDERQESIDETIENRSSRMESEIVGRTQPAVRSYSTDVTAARGVEKSIVEQRRHTDCSDPRAIATRWIPQVNGGKFRRESSPLARNDCEITQSAATRWITFAKSPSPSPIPKINPERRDSISEHSKKDEEPRKDSDASNCKWQPSRKFSPVKNEKAHLQRQDELDVGRDRSSSCIDTNERANKLSQRMRDLYDFKTENEWPKRAGSSRENTWISKSSSEEEKGNYRPIRRNSQDLEFNDRIDIFKTKVEPEEDRQRPKRNTHDTSEVFMDDEDERLRRFNDKLRYSEDRSTRARGRERRTYSDDYDEKTRRASRQPESPKTIRRDRLEAPTRSLANNENKRNSDVSARSHDSRVSYVEVDFTKRDSRTSDASYASVNLGKRGSVECKNTQKIYEMPPRRAFSQSDERPSTPVPPIEFNDERYVPKKLSSESSERDSTRYKVYLT